MGDIKLVPSQIDGDLAISSSLPDRLILPMTISLEQNQIDIAYDLVKTSGGAITTNKETLTGGLGFSGGFGGDVRKDTEDAISLFKKHLKADNVILHYLDKGRIQYIQPRQPTFRLPRGLKLCEFSVRAVTSPSEVFARFETATNKALSNGGNVVIETLGNEKMYPVITITATSNISSINIASTTNGKLFDISYALVTNDILILDCEELTAKVNGSGILNHIGPDFRSDFPLLEGTNTLVFTFTGSATVHVTHRDKWA